MRVGITAVGRMKPGPDRDLFEDYRTRFERTGRGLGFASLSVSELDDRKASGKAAEGAGLLRLMPDKAVVCALDERGKVVSSPDFAARLADWRDAGRADVQFVIGGADGLDRSVLDRADFKLSLGAMVWPHMLVRVMLAEQLYRATSILAGLPYHRA